ncbi:MAG: cellobiose phosphorylase, partial [Candidatus Omnitrophica bacterium]|nr:cellobiose phosphorylase [Candidatus Omnitrophota bacterium]
QIVPYGTNNFCLKKMSRTIEAWMSAENLERKAPFYRLTVDPADRPEVVHIKEGNFYLGFSCEKRKVKLIKPIIDPDNIFGTVTDFSCPRLFLGEKFSRPYKETIRSKTPSAFIYSCFTLKKNEEKIFYVLSGYMRSLTALNASLERIVSPEYMELKRVENIKVINALLEDIKTGSGSKEFNLYTQQTYMDNILRGGYPLTFDSGEIFYIYSRKHGDPERDYNKFQLSPTYLSQGNGNYRDLNQNRRSDIWFNPQVKDENIFSLIDLIQLDGFNPLVVKGAAFIIRDEQRIKSSLKNICNGSDINKILSAFLDKKFSPGELIHFIEDNRIKLNAPQDQFLSLVLSSSLKTNEAEHAEGFWSDHWHYNLDLIDSYLAVYPEKLKKVLFENNNFTFFDNAEVVKPRNEKYLLHNSIPRQLHAITLDVGKKELIHKRKESTHIARKEYGYGDIYRTTLINKLLCLLANKYASLDPFGVGIEMESDKPNWFDSLNGLPALFGSSICETFELKRLAVFIKESAQKTGVEKISVTEEIYDYLEQLAILTEEYFKKSLDDYGWWDKTHSLKEGYRNKTKLGVKGNEQVIPSSKLLEIIDLIIKKIELGLSKGRDKKSRLYHGYFMHEVTEYQPLKDYFIKPTAFKQIPLPLFLEPQMHALRLNKDKNKAQAIYKGVLKSGLFDKKLKMYKITAALKTMPEEIGRCRIFPPGWLENESVWLHMEYKYMLELLKTGLHEEFYENFKRVLIPFQDPKQYGRSILENSSFLVSSAFADKKLHGNGFVARLSGSTAEFLEMWIKINVGINPFFLDNNGELNLRFNPILSGWLFDKKGRYSFNFLSKINVTYYNPKRKNTFGKNSARVTRIVFDDTNGLPVEITSDTLKPPYAEKVRLRKIKQIDIYLK